MKEKRKNPRTINNEGYSAFIPLVGSREYSPDKAKERLVACIEAYRVAVGLTQRDLSEKIGYPAPNLNYAYNRNFSPIRAIHISRMLNVDLNYIFFGENKMAAEKATDQNTRVNSLRS